MSDFSSMPLAKGYFAPNRFDASVHDCEVVGSIPVDMDGAFYRMHADWLYPPKHADEASLSADGYISMLRFRGGSVDYRGRYVRTQRYLRQAQARRQLYGYYRNPFTDEESVRDTRDFTLRTSANTTPVIVGKRLYAAKEEGPAWRVDPDTLETIGPDDFGGLWKADNFTAHPKLDPATGELLAFGYEAAGLCSDDVYAYIFDPEGNIHREIRVKVPYASMIHDMAFTETHIILPASSMVTSMERLLEGKKHWGWDRTVPSYFCVFRRDGDGSDARWFLGREHSIVHTANAYNDGDRIVLDLPMADGNTWPFFEDIHGGPFSMHDSTIRRVVLDLSSDHDGYQEQVLLDRPVTTFTRIDERFAGRRHRYIYVQYADNSQPFEASLPDDPRQQPNNSIMRFDVDTGEVLSYWAGPHHVVQEPVFVPRRHSTAEGDGYLVATVHNLGERRAECVVLDATRMRECARVILPFRNPMQVHGTWADAEMLDLA